MYAIVEVGGKQYKVEKDKVLNIGKISGDKSEQISLDKVLMFVDGENVQIGQPYLKNVRIVAKNLGEVKGKKVLGVKFKKRKNYTRTIGFRPEYTQLKIEDLSLA